MTLSVKYILTAFGLLIIIAILYFVLKSSKVEERTTPISSTPDSEATLLFHDISEQNTSIVKAISQLPSLREVLHSDSVAVAFRHVYGLTTVRERALDSLTNVMVKVQNLYSFKSDSISTSKIKGAMHALLAYDDQKDQTKYFDTLFVVLSQKTAPPDTNTLFRLVDAIRRKDSTIVTNIEQAAIPFKS